MDGQGQIALVTGGASGLGEARARALANGGAKVAIFDVDAERGQAVANEMGGKFAEVDVSNDVQVLAGLEKVTDALGSPSILLNCAGAAPDVAIISYKVSVSRWTPIAGL